MPMPTTSEATGHATAAADDSTDALEGVYHSLRSSEATGEEAIAATILAFTDLLREAVPVAMSQPGALRGPELRARSASDQLSAALLLRGSVRSPASYDRSVV